MRTIRRALRRSRARQTWAWFPRWLGSRTCATSPVLPSVAEDPSGLRLRWQGGDGRADTSHYHWPWLRDHCKCASCVHPDSGQKLRYSGHASVTGARPHTVQLSSDGQRVSVRWRDGHASQWSVDWLRGNSYAEEHVRQRLEAWRSGTQPWRGGDAWEPVAVPWGELSAATSPEHTLYRRVVAALWRDGMVLVNDVPREPKPDVSGVASVASLFGTLRSSFYGTTWDVRSVPNAGNVAYTSDDLGWHQDLFYFESPPGLQFLHCLENEVSGGMSCFLDGYEAVRLLKQRHPDSYKVLVKTPVVYEYHVRGYHYRFERPIIVPPSANHPLTLNWSPPFQGALQAPHRVVPDWYTAVHRLHTILTERNLMWSQPPVPGQCVVFHNRRIFHARTGFDPEEGHRHLQGTYVNLDEFYDRRRMCMQHEQGDQSPP